MEEVKTETKKWVITSVIDPRTDKKISFDDALIERVLDQERGKYCNPETGFELSIGQAIEKNLIQVRTIVGVESRLSTIYIFIIIIIIII